MLASLGPIVTLLIIIALVGFAAWLITYLVPMDQKFKVAIYAFAGVWCVLRILQFFSLWHGGNIGIDLLIVTAIIGLVAWALTYFIPMPEKLKTGIMVLACLCLLVYCLQYFGGFDGLHGTHMKK